MSYCSYNAAMMSVSKEMLGDSIRKARQARGLRQEDVAAGVGVDKKQIGRWERGENAPGSLALGRLISYFRGLQDSPDLKALDAAVDTEVASLIAEHHESYSDEERRRMMVIFDILFRHPRMLDKWLTFGDGLVAGIDDKP